MSYDNACKLLANEYPGEFIRLFFGVEATEIQILKTELSIEPIRADSVIFVATSSAVFHLEFETLPQSDATPIPLRSLDYYIRLKRQYNRPIRQLVVFLKETTSPLVFENQYRDSNTRHRYQVIRMWEQDPKPFLASPGLLPLATLARSNAPTSLLAQVAEEVAKIEDESGRRNLSGCAQILAGLRYDKDLIRKLFREDIMKESVIYQDILAQGIAKGRTEGRLEGRTEGRTEGRREGELGLVQRLMARRFGEVDPEIIKQIQGLSIEQLESLGESLFDFTDI
ncbi:MAG TPA: Rpn family recombination-promoting nuclease/putative transposase, partial [Oscillatoriaceae cyanobacterium M33_DOE_052]|nr:Rpn family recombination-promoting nuclease/putative transposase [Oscillatoriaceae cyanobacterium M33_DOE_052]